MYEVLDLPLQPINFKAALHSFVGAHYGMALILPSRLQRPPARLCRHPCAEVLWSVYGINMLAAESAHQRSQSDLITQQRPHLESDGVCQIRDGDRQTKLGTSFDL